MKLDTKTGLKLEDVYSTKELALELMRGRSSPLLGDLVDQDESDEEDSGVKEV